MRNEHIIPSSSGGINMFHSSPNKINNGDINSLGIAGDCLFLSDDIYQMSGSSIYVYEADFDCVRASQLYDESIIEEIADYFDCDAGVAESLLDASASEWDLNCDAEKSWWLQGKRGDCAVKMGFDGCEDKDEQGVVYIVPMTGRESELKMLKVLTLPLR